MDPLAVSFLVFASLVGMGLLAARLRTVLPDHHLSAETKDTVKLAMGLVATMTALVLGLMVASAKGTYDAQKTDVIVFSAKLMVLDRMMAHYGPESAPLRAGLKPTVARMESQLWPNGAARPAQLDPSAVSGDGLYDAVQALSPRDDSQRTVKADMLASILSLGELRWLLFEQSGHSISVPFLAVVICWLAILFFSFGLFAPSNATASLSLMVSALSVAGAIFLILELDQPFGGLIRISNAPMQSVLAHLGQ